MIFPLIYIVSLLKDKVKIHKLVYIPYIIMILISSYFISPNTYMLKIKKDDLVQYKFRKIIMKEKNPTILNYGYVDMGFYTVTGIVPNTRYFEKLLIKTPSLLIIAQVIIYLKYFLKKNLNFLNIINKRTFIKKYFLNHFSPRFFLGNKYFLK